MHSIRILLSSIMLAVLFVFSACAGGGQDDKVRCVNSTANACVVPLYALYSKGPAQYLGLQVTTTGFLRRVGRDYLLFPDENLAKYAVPEQAFVLVDDTQQFTQELAENNGQYVQVVGELRDPVRPIFWAAIVLDNGPQIVPVHVGEEFHEPPPPPRTNGD
jgi:hypothetical protein